MIMAYAELDKRKLCVFLRLGYYALFPIILLQFFQVLDCPNFKNKVNMDLSNHKAVGNAFESGFNFSLSHSIWEKVLAEIEDRNCRISYLKGTVDSHMPAGYLALSKLSQEEKKIFLKYTEKQSSLNMSKD